MLPKLPKTKLTTPSTTESILQTQYENLGARLEAVGAPVDDRGFLGRLLNLEQDQGFFMDVLEVLDRPGQAVKGLLAPTEGDDPFTGFAKGLAGMTDRSGLETLIDLGVTSEGEIENMAGVTKFIANVGIDLVTDPLTYLPAGAISKTLGKLNPFKQEEVIKVAISQVDDIKRGYKAAIDSYVAAGDDLATATAKAKVDFDIIETSQVQKVSKSVKQKIKTARNKIDDLRAKGFNDKQIVKTKVDDGGLSWKDWEAIAMDDLSAELGKYADDMNIVGANFEVTSLKGSDAPGKMDLDVLLKLDDGYARVAQIQVKNAGKGVAAGATAVMGKGRAGLLGFADHVELNPQAQKLLQDNYSNIMVTVGGKRRSVSEVVTEAVEKAKQGTKAQGFTFSSKNVSADDLETIQRAARDIMDTQYADTDFIYAVAQDGTTGLFRWGNIKKNINYKAGLRVGDTSGGKLIQPRMQIGIELKKMPMEKLAIQDLANQVFNVKNIDKTITTKLGFFEWAAKKDNLFTPVAKKVVSFKKWVGKNFNPFFQVGDETAATFKKLSAKSQLIVTDEGRRLAVLGEEAIRRAPNGNEIVQELIESGARIVDGKVVIDTTYMTMSDTLRMFNDDWLKYGDDMPLVIYGSTPGYRQRTADKLLNRMNTAARSASGVDDAFMIIKKGDDYVLSLNNITPDELSRLMQSKEFLALTGEKVSFGRKYLSDEYNDFFLQNEDLVNQYKNSFDNIMDIYEKELGIQNIPDAIKTTNGYMRHKLSNQGLDWMRQNKPLVYSKYLREGVDFLANRKYMGTADDINRIMKTMYDIDFDFFDTQVNHSLADLLRVGATKQESGDILKAVLQGADDADRPLFQIVENTQAGSLGDDYDYILDFKEEFSKLYENLAPDARKVLDDYLSAQGYVKGGTKAIALHKAGASTLKRIEKAYVEVPEILKGYDALLSQWKGLNLVTPSFHLNNFFGNSINSYLVGMGVLDQSRYLTKSGSYLRQYNRILSQIDNIIISGGTRMDAINALSKGDREIYDALVGYLTSGASMKGRGVRNLEGVAKTLEEGGQTNLYQNLLKANFDLAENADELQRFSLYLWAYENELGSAVDALSKASAQTKAANTVFESLFDYTHFTRFEQDVMKRLIPFYTFMKNNLVFQMRNIIRNPQQYNKLGRAYKYYVSDIAGLEDEDMPEYARNNMWLPIPITINRGDKETITFLKANLPPAEFGELIESRFARGISSLTVPIKLPIELALNRDIFTGAEIKEFAGQKDRMEEGTGVFSFLRDEQGMAALSGDPVIQKVASDLGLRVPARYITTALGIADAAAGYKDPEDAFAEALNSLGILSIKESENIRVTNLYQALEKYREAEKRWEQEQGINLPSKAELGLP